MPALTSDPFAVVILAEVVEALAPAGDLRCVPTVALEDGTVRIVLTIPDGLRARDLRDRVQYVADVGNIRGFALKYGIDPKKLEHLLIGAKQEG